MLAWCGGLFTWPMAGGSDPGRAEPGQAGYCSQSHLSGFTKKESQISSSRFPGLIAFSSKSKRFLTHIFASKFLLGDSLDGEQV